MIAEPTVADPRALIGRQIAMLSELAEIGMDLAREARTCGPERDPALIFSRAARAVRLTIALQSRLLKDLADLDKADHLARVDEAGKRRLRLHRGFERAIENTCDDEDETDWLCEDARERLTEIDHADLLDGPLHEVAARICADLQLSPEISAAVLAGLGPPGLDADRPAALPLIGDLAVQPVAQPRTSPSRRPPPSWSVVPESAARACPGPGGCTRSATGSTAPARGCEGVLTHP